MAPSFHKRGNRLYGFTLIELMVTVAIFVFMTALLLSRYNTYNSGTLLTNLAYDVALAIRHAQTFGLSVVDSSDNKDDTIRNFNAGYGVNFNINSPTMFIMFADTNSNTGIGRYDGNSSAADANVNEYRIKRGAKITELCVGNGTSCSNSAQIINIAYKRPDPSAIIIASLDGLSYSTFTYAQITISDAGGQSSRIIKVNQVGQVSIQE